jgi:integrase
MSLKKRGKKYYSVYQSPNNRETWIALDATNKRIAQQKHDAIMASFKRERATNQLTNALLELAKSLAADELNHADLKGAAAGIERMARLDALKVIDEIIPIGSIFPNDLWLKYLSTDPQIKPSTLKAKSQRFQIWNNFCTASMDMRKINERDCRRFLASLNSTRSQTLNNYISDLSSVWKASPELDNPWGAYLRRRSDIEHKKPFTPDQVRQIIAHCTARPKLQFWKNAVYIAYYTGLRFVDVVHLRWTHIDDNYIDLKPIKTERLGKRVRVPIRPRLQSILNNIPKKNDEDLIFSYESAVYDDDHRVLVREFNQILFACKIKQKGDSLFGFHSLRHTFVTQATDAGVEQKDIQAVVGHAAAIITDQYYHGEKNADLTAYPDL